MHLEEFANTAAEKVAGAKPAEGEAALDFAAIIELVMSIVSQIVDNCPASDAEVVKAVKKPNLVQRAKFRALVSRECNNCWRAHLKDQSGKVSQAMLELAESTPEADALAVVYEARNPDWMLI